MTSDGFDTTIKQPRLRLGTFLQVPQAAQAEAGQIAILALPFEGNG